MRTGFLSLPVPGHLYPMTSLARKLQSRGHDVVFISLVDMVRPSTAGEKLEHCNRCVSGECHEFDN
jgi:UDP:flavonoid glycosyltransferase YjiC (YdhE family)